MKKYYLLLFMLMQHAMNAQDIQKKLQTVFEKNHLMGLTVHTFSNKKESTYNFGLRNITNNLIVNNDTKFRIASISKAFTAIGLMKLYDKKMIKLDEDVSKYLGYKIENPNFPKQKITFRMLLSHTSSLNDGEGYDSFLEGTYRDAIIPNINSVFLVNQKYYTNDMWLNQKPGTYYKYCNLNFGLIATLIEKITNQRFDIYMKNEVLEPLRINSSYNIEDINDIENIATLYRSENKDWKPTKDDYKAIKSEPTDLSNYQLGTNGSYFGPQGGLRVSTQDLAIFLKFLKSNGKTIPNLLSISNTKLMKKAQWCFKPQNGDTYNGFFKRYGLGLHIINTDTTDIIADSIFFGNFIGHAGDAYGLISDAYFSSKQDFGFIIITNGSINEFTKGKKSSFFEFEEEIFKIICDDFTINKAN